MTKQINTDELLDILTEIDPDGVQQWQTQIEAITSQMAERVALLLNVQCGSASFEGTGFAGTCVPFWGRPGQACPEPLKDYDETEWTDEDGEPIKVTEQE